jgi:hypothetical protein
LQTGPARTATRPCAEAERVVRIASNLPVLPVRLDDGVRIENSFVRLCGNAVRDGFRYFWWSWSRDAVVLHVPDRELLVLCLLRWLMPFARARLVVVDLILTTPNRTWRQRLVAGMKRLLLRQVDLYLLHQKDVSGMEAAYGTPPERVRYVPYKVNSLATVLAMDPEEGDYVFTGGRSRRDYSTFCAAVAGLDCPTVLLTPRPEENAVHETYFDGATAPAHVRVVHDDGSPKSWIEHIARARVVVVCVSASSISPSGVGTYLLAMALGKCVIVTDSPATRGVLEHEREAVIVPTGDVEALRAAVRRVWEDDVYRRRIAAAGRAYALSLGGVESLQRNVARAVAEFLSASEG